MSEGLLTSRWVSMSAKFLMEKMARRFIGGESPGNTIKTVRELRSNGMGVSIDFLGEATLSESEAGINQ